MGILIASPGTDTRLSEEVLCHAIMQHYKEHHKIPVGISEEVLWAWAAKMASAAVKLGSRFKRLLSLSENAKSKVIQEMKHTVRSARLEKKKASADLPSPDPVEILDHDDVFDWVKLEQQLVAVGQGTERKDSFLSDASTAASPGQASTSPEQAVSSSSQVADAAIALGSVKPVHGKQGKQENPLALPESA